MKILIAKRNSAFGITKGHSYKVEAGNGSDVVLVENDVKVKLWVNKDLFESEELNNAKRIADEASALAERERIRDIVAEQVRNSCLPGGEIYSFTHGLAPAHCNGWHVQIANNDPIVSMATEKVVESIVENAQFNAFIESEPNEYVKVLEQLREVLRVPEGENIVAHAKVIRALADALIGLQNSTFC